MSLRTSLKALLGLAWHVKGDAVVDAMTPAADGVMEAGKPLVPTTGGVVDTLDITSPKIGGTALAATAAEIDRVADVSARVVSLSTASPTLAVADHEGKLLVLNRATGVAVTLPAATGSGSVFHFIVGTSFSGGSFVATCTGDDTLKGLALGLDGDGVPANAWAAGASDEVFTMDGSTQGGVVGDEVIFRDIKADVWQVQARLQQSGTEATPFSSAA